MEKFIIGGSRIDEEETGIRGVYRTMPHCSFCKKELKTELWIKPPRESLFVMESPGNYIRIIFGVHPEIYSSVRGPVPAVYTPVYFCEECERIKGPYISLLRIFLSFEPMIHPSVSDNQFDPQRGCWITIWPIDKQAKPTWPINYQVNISIFEEIAKKLMHLPENPYRVIERCHVL